MEFAVRGLFLVAVIGHVIVAPFGNKIPIHSQQLHSEGPSLSHSTGSGLERPSDASEIDGDEFELEDSVFKNKIPYVDYNVSVIDVDGTNVENVSDEEGLRLQLGVQFFTFPTRNKEYTEVRIGDRRSLAYSGLIPGKPVHIFAHGFGGRAPQKKHYSIINAYLNEGASNVVVVNYQSVDPEISDIPIVVGISYFAAQWKYAPSAGQRVADFVAFLKGNGIIKDASQVHLIGHSLGGHVMGVAGHFLQIQYGMKVGRITGLDVAGPMYDHFPLENKLDHSDASFVDVVHTDIDGVGIAPAIGHVDYYVNGGLGRSQNLCQFSRPGLTRVASYVKNVICAHDQRPLRIWGYGVPERVNLQACPCSSPYRKRVKVNKFWLRLGNDNFTSAAPSEAEVNTEIETSWRHEKFCARPSARTNCIRFGEYTPVSSRGRYYLRITDRTFRQILVTAKHNEA